MRIMSFNLRYDNEEDGQYRWSNRFPAIKEVWEKHSPDIVGIQEGLPHQIADLKSTLKSYNYFGTGRTKDEKSEQIGIFYKKNQDLQVEDNGHFWLSKTPHIKGSKDFNSDVPRLANWILFNFKNSFNKIILINTHYDNVSRLAREKSSEIISDFIKKRGKHDKLILTGDFNTRAGSRSIKTLLQDLHLKDALFEIGVEDKTFHNFEGEGIFRIDYIFCSKEIKIKDGKVIKSKYHDIYPSDHYPIYVDLAF